MYLKKICLITLVLWKRKGTSVMVLFPLLIVGSILPVAVAFDLPLRSFVVIVILGTAAVTDIYRGIIPNALIISSILLSIYFMLSGVIVPGVSLLAGTAALAGGLGIRVIGNIFWGTPGLGMGDVKLFLMTGVLLGWEVLWLMYLSFVAGGLFALMGLSTGFIQKKDRLPFAPFVLTAYLIAQFLQPAMFFGPGTG